jgi:hypothetical protein
MEWDMDVQVDARADVWAELDVQTCRYNKWMLWEEEQRQGSISKLLQTVQIPMTLIMQIRVGVPSRVPRTRSMDRHGALSGVSIHEYRIAVRQMDNTARVEFRVESERGHEWKSKWCWRRKIHMSVMGRRVKDVRICLKVDKHAGGPWSLTSLCLYTGDALANITN